MNLTRVSGVIYRHYYHLFHQSERVLDVFFFPTMLLFLMGFLAQFVAQLSDSPIAGFIVGGVLLWIVFEKTQTDIGVSFMWEIWERNLLNVLATPLTLVEYIFGLFSIAFIKVFIAFVAVSLLATWIYGFPVYSLGVALAGYWAILLLFAWAFAMFSLTLVLIFGHGVGPLTWSLPFLLQPVAAVYYPVSILPDFLQKVAALVPLSYVFEGMREILEYGTFSVQNIFVALSLSLFYIMMTLGLFYITFKRVKKSGKLVKLV